MKKPGYQQLAQQVNEMLSERDIKALELEDHRKIVKGFQEAEDKLKKEQQNAMQDSIKNEEIAEKLMREIRFESSSCTQDLMGDADFDDPSEEDEAPFIDESLRPRSKSPPTPKPEEDRGDWRSLGRDGVGQVRWACYICL